jgi:hypothetical protein
MNLEDAAVADLTLDELAARVEYLLLSIDSLRDELADTEAELDRRSAA